MAGVDKFAEIVKRVLSDVEAYVPVQEGIRKECVFDDVCGHYQLLQIGWKHQRRIHGTLVHVDIRDGKVWVEHDGTNLEIVQDLLDAGIPQECMVLGFHPPELRHLTEFAVG